MPPCRSVDDATNTSMSHGLRANIKGQFALDEGQIAVYDGRGEGGRPATVVKMKSEPAIPRLKPSFASLRQAPLGHSCVTQTARADEGEFYPRRAAPVLVDLSYVRAAFRTKGVVWITSLNRLATVRGRGRLSATRQSSWRVRTIATTVEYVCRMAFATHVTRTREWCGFDLQNLRVRGISCRFRRRLRLRP